MFDLHDPSLEKEKCYTTIGTLPAYIDPRQPPSKSPFTAIKKHPFIHRAEIILPEEAYQAIAWESLKIPSLQYARVILPLSAILEGEFFNKYVKSGDVLMVSERRTAMENAYYLKDGILRLELAKNAYERIGLVGKPIRAEGRKHEKLRYAVEINLRLPSMLHGKKAFERVVWAFKNVLDASVTWLFCDLLSPSNLSDTETPIKEHYPQIINLSPTVTKIENVLTPPIHTTTFQEDEEDKNALPEVCAEMQEWLALVSLDSERIHADDNISPYLSRYVVPDREHCQSSNLVRITWTGLIPSYWIRGLLVQMHRVHGRDTPNSCHWFGLLTSALYHDVVDSRGGYTILTLPYAEPGTKAMEETETTAKEAKDGESRRRGFVCWEYAGGKPC